MCLHFAFDLLFVGLSTGIVSCINLLVSHGRIGSPARGRVGAWEYGCVEGTYVTLLTVSVSGPSFFVSNNIPNAA